MSNVIPIGVCARPEAMSSRDLTETDLAAAIRSGTVEISEIERRSAFDRFSEWLHWRGFQVLRHGKTLTKPDVAGSEDQVYVVVSEGDRIAMATRALTHWVQASESSCGRDGVEAMLTAALMKIKTRKD